MPKGWSRSIPRPTGATASRAELVGVSLASDCNKACYIPLEHGGDDMFAERPDQLPPSWCSAKLKPLLEDPAVLKIGHNLKYDWIVLDRRGIDVAPYDDTIVMSFDLDAGGLNSHRHGRARREASRPQCIAFKDLCGTGKKQISFHQVQLDRGDRYAAEDADVTLRLWSRFKPRLPTRG